MAESLSVNYNPQKLFRPTSVKEAVSLLSQFGSKARVVAGNTSLYEFARQSALSDVEYLVDLAPLGLNYVREDEENRQLLVGAMTTFTHLSRSSLVDQSYLALKDASKKITPPQIRNAGTMGGSLCSGLPFYDMPVTLLALDASLKIASETGEKDVKISDFFVDYFVTALSPEDLLVEIKIPQKPRSQSAFVKLGRMRADFAVVNCAASLTLDDDMRSIKDARVALGAVANVPIRVTAVENALIGKEVSEETVVQASRIPLSLEPTPSVHASSNYKKRVIPPVIRDTLLTVVDRVFRNQSD